MLRLSRGAQESPCIWDLALWKQQAKQESETMETLDPRKDGMSSDLVAENIDRLRELFPEVFKEGRVDFELLRQTLGERVEKGPEPYSFTWPGKSRARQMTQMPSSSTLRPCPAISVDWDTTQNLFVEGDNLEVLKLLQRSYRRRVKLIYIDPPYNTGKEFIYSDRFQESSRSYLKHAGQAVGGSSSPETSGRYHSNWLNMIYPRLMLARNLLREDGVMCVSIDEHEVGNLLKVLGELFGEENLLGTIANVHNPKGRSDGAFLATAHEYLIVVAKNREKAKVHGFEPEEKILRRYNKIADNGRRYRLIDLRKTGDSDRRVDRPAMFYFFYYNPQADTLRVGREFAPRESEHAISPLKKSGEDGRWRWGLETAKARLERLEARFMPNRNIWGVFEKDYLDNRSAVKPTTAWTSKDVNSERGSESFISLGFPKGTFPRPKPIGTMERILRFGTLPGEESLVLDFFAGSCSLVEAVHGLLASGERRLRYIMVQLPVALCPKKTTDAVAHQFCMTHQLEPSIAAIGRERIRRSAARVDREALGGGLDLGFRAFKLDSSNIKAWDAGPEAREESQDQLVQTIKSERSEEDVVYELLLKFGLDLALPIESRRIQGHKVHLIGGGALVVCLSLGIDLALVDGIAALRAELAPEVMRVIFRDAGFADGRTKINAFQRLQQAGVDTIKSL